ncbi:MAG TPA: hypothetical protein VIY86_01975, partial [Pirellulaceae bacterium]
MMSTNTIAVPGPRVRGSAMELLPLCVAVLVGLFWPCQQHAWAGAIFNFSNAALGGGSRWDAAPRMISLSGTPFERSLDGGLRYSLQGGSFTAYRDLFSWTSLPTVAAFSSAVQQAFDAWGAIDPVSGIGSTLTF